MKWYRVTRRYVVEQHVYVKATNGQDARAKVEAGDWESETGEDTIRYHRPRNVTPLDGIPRFVWEDLGYPDDEKIAEPPA